MNAFRTNERYIESMHAGGWYLNVSHAGGGGLGGEGGGGGAGGEGGGAGGLGGGAGGGLATSVSNDPGGR